MPILFRRYFGRWAGRHGAARCLCWCTAPDPFHPGLFVGRI